MDENYHVLNIELSDVTYIRIFDLNSVKRIEKYAGRMFVLKKLNSNYFGNIDEYFYMRKIN